MADDPLRMMESEFKLWGVKFQHRLRGSGHIELRWQVSEHKAVRSHIIAKTPSDHRWFLNERATIRRLFRADGLDLKEEIRKEAEKPALIKALAIPDRVEPTHELIKLLRAEVTDLTDIVLELSMRLNQTLPPVAPPTVEQPEPPAESVPMPAELPPGRKQPFRSVNAIDHVSDGWNTIDTIAKSMNVPTIIAYRKLRYLKAKNLVEVDDDRWRRKPAPALVKLARRGIGNGVRGNGALRGERLQRGKI